MKRNAMIIAGLILAIYAASRIYRLTILPVFADEAIYIRWAQMIVHDPKQYLFLPLYDGKTPLYMWLLIPVLNLAPLDPLLASRLLSGVCGLISLVTSVLIVKTLHGSNRAQVGAALLSIMLPFTLFHNRMGLIDSMLTALLAVSFWCLLKWRATNRLPWIAGAGLFWGFALLAKPSAFYYLPVPTAIFVYDWIRRPKTRNIRSVVAYATALVTGLACILWMNVSPLFPFLFQRSSDFAFTFNEIIHNPFHIVGVNSYRIGKWLLTYLTPGMWLIFGGYLATAHRLGIPPSMKRAIYLLFSCAVLFVAPFVVSGKLLSSRYFLPISIWLIPAGALIIDTFWRRKRSLGVLAFAVVVLFSVRFAWFIYRNPESIPFPHEDQVQYLTEWSAGYGIPEVRDFINRRAADRRIIVATEGYFGTLPDGLLMYFDRSPIIKNVEIYGIGQPITALPSTLEAKTNEGDVYLVVNEHRLNIEPLPDNVRLVATYPRPYGGPALLLFQIIKRTN